MIVLADNDILIKLACCDLFVEFQNAFGVTAEDIRILKTARFSITTPKHRRRIGEASFSRLTAFLAAIADIDTNPDPAIIAALTEQTNINPGEAVLYTVCPCIPNSVIVTGDNKSLAGLAAARTEDATCAELYHALAGRVFCFEHVLSRILEQFGFSHIRQRLIDGRECDRGLALWLGSGLDATESGFRDGLASYLNHARQECGELLAT
ncbi:MAG: hypothetical protein RMJ52_07895 [Gemmataceae bacterium]|nr:hypothetical protein [Gemmataceae bacterium]